MKKTRIVQIIREEIEKVMTENFLAEDDLNEMATFYKIKGDQKAAKAAIAQEKGKYKEGTSLYNTLDALEKKGEIDYKELAKATGKDVATWNNPKSRGVLEKDLVDFVEWESAKRGRQADPNKPQKEKKEKGTSVKKDTKDDVAYSSTGSSMTTTKDTPEKDIKKAVSAILKSQPTRKLKTGKGNNDVKDQLDAHITSMKDKAKQYKVAKENGDEEKVKSLTQDLKGMTAKKTELMDKWDKSVGKMGKDQELDPTED